MSLFFKNYYSGVLSTLTFPFTLNVQSLIQLEQNEGKKKNTFMALFRATYIYLIYNWAVEG